jgi:DNA-binding XRE family transcriptional regulator
VKITKDNNLNITCSTELIDRKELARRLDIDPRTVINLEVRKIIPAVRIARCVRYDWGKIKSIFGL